MYFTFYEYGVINNLLEISYLTRDVAMFLPLTSSTIVSKTVLARVPGLTTHHVQVLVSLVPGD